MDPGDQTRRPGARRNFGNCLDDRRFGGFQGWLIAKREAKVGGADIDPVDSVHPKDRVKVGQGFAGFDHRKDKNLLVGISGVSRTMNHVRARGAERAATKRRIARGLHQTARVLLGVDHRADQAGETGIETFHDDTRLVPRHTA